MKWMLGFLLIVAVSFAGEAESQVLARPHDLWDIIYKIWLIISVVIYAVVAIPSLYFMIKYRFKPGEREIGDQEHEGHWGLEALWTIVPLIIVLYLATHGFALFTQMRKPPENAMELKVTAFAWGWMFQYPNGKMVIAQAIKDTDDKKCKPEECYGIDGVFQNYVYIPAGVPIKAVLTSQDVIHSFYVQPAGVTQDMVPGRTTYAWFQINKPGEYWVFCREYCGQWHSRMFAKLKVVPKEEFDKWLKGEVADTGHEGADFKTANIENNKAQEVVR